MLLTYYKRVYPDANPYGYPAYTDSNGVLWADLTPTEETPSMANLTNTPNPDCKRFTFAKPREVETGYLWRVKPCELSDADALREALPEYLSDAEKAGLAPTITGFMEYTGNTRARYRNYRRKRRDSASVEVVEALRNA